MKWRCAVTTLGMFCILPVVHAQSVAVTVPLDSGTAVRVTTNVQRASGSLLARYGKGDPSLTLCTASWNPCGANGDSAGRRRFAAAEILRLDIRRGNHAKTGAIVGGVAGGLVGGFFGLMAAGLCDSAHCPNIPLSTLKGLLLGGGLVGSVGAGVGSLFPKWGPAP